jgi:hypothetical protein
VDILSVSSSPTKSEKSFPGYPDFTEADADGHSGDTSAEPLVELPEEPAEPKPSAEPLVEVLMEPPAAGIEDALALMAAGVGRVDPAEHRKKNAKGGKRSTTGPAKGGKRSRPSDAGNRCKHEGIYRTVGPIATTLVFDLLLRSGMETFEFLGVTIQFGGLQ